jgi:hypothetical protein
MLKKNWKNRGMIAEILEEDRRLRMAYKGFSKRKKLVKIFEDFINEFLIDTELTPLEIINLYNSFLKLYLQRCREFSAHGLYPFQVGEPRLFRRTDYDIALNLSILFSEHRYRIIENLYGLQLDDNESVLIVGLGSGLEVDLLMKSNENKLINIDGYDMDMGQFVKKRFAGTINLFEEKFQGNGRVYDKIVAIELLEHLLQPYEFLQDCYNSLKKGGLCLCTAATNMPQDDHLYNFDNDDHFLSQVAEIGFHVDVKNDIIHKSNFRSINSKNTWYQLSKI